MDVEPKSQHRDCSQTEYIAHMQEGKILLQSLIYLRNTMPTGRAETHTGGICFFETHELERITMAVITVQLPPGMAQM